MLETINRILGVATPFSVLAAGIFFSCFLRGLPFSRLRIGLRAILRQRNDGVSPFRSLALALAGTLGVGNIVGVSSAIALGGFGAVFWMWISALAAMFLKYAEVVLAVKHREALPNGAYRGGAPYYIRACFSQRGALRLGNGAALLFAVLCLVNALMMGCVIQSNAVASASGSAFGVSPWLCGILLALLCFTLLIRGSHAITAVTGVLVPVMSGAFLILSLAVLYLRREAIPEALLAIVKDAFRPESAAGGAFGFLLSRGLRFGTIRGIISNEAGCGTSPTAHAASSAKSPVEQGLFGILEVFVDTILLCTVTALVVVIHYGEVSHLTADPMRMTLAAYCAPFDATCAALVEKLLSLAILCFGFATMLCWAHYGNEALIFLLRVAAKRDTPVSGKHQRSTLLFSLCFCAAALLGAIAAPLMIWSLTDLVTGVMTLLNTFVLCLCAKQIRSETLSYFGARKGRIRRRDRSPSAKPPSRDARLTASRRP